MSSDSLLKIGDLTAAHPTLLAPMATLTDIAFRRLLDEIGGPGIMVSEMVAAEGLVRRNRRTLEMIRPFHSRIPQFIQLFGSKPESFAAASALISQEQGISGIDINMGCPVKKVVRNGAGASLLNDHQRAAAIISSVRSQTRLPVLVKIRLGYETVNVLDMIKVVEGAGADGLVVHLRLASESYGRKAKWEWLAKIKARAQIPVIGNGDIGDAADAREKLKLADGIMIGRAAMANPFIFTEIAGRETGPDAMAFWIERFCQLLEEYYPPRLALSKIKAHLRFLKVRSAEAKKIKQEIFLCQDYSKSKALLLLWLQAEAS